MAPDDKFNNIVGRSFRNPVPMDVVQSWLKGEYLVGQSDAAGYDYIGWSLMIRGLYIYVVTCDLESNEIDKNIGGALKKKNMVFKDHKGRETVINHAGIGSIDIKDGELVYQGIRLYTNDVLCSELKKKNLKERLRQMLLEQGLKEKTVNSLVRKHGGELKKLASEMCKKWEGKQRENGAKEMSDGDAQWRTDVGKDKRFGSAASDLNMSRNVGSPLLQLVDIRPLQEPLFWRSMFSKLTRVNKDKDPHVYFGSVLYEPGSDEERQRGLYQDVLGWLEAEEKRQVVDGQGKKVAKGDAGSANSIIGVLLTKWNDTVEKFRTTGGKRKDKAFRLKNNQYGFGTKSDRYENFCKKAGQYLDGSQFAEGLTRVIDSAAEDKADDIGALVHINLADWKNGVLRGDVQTVTLNDGLWPKNSGAIWWIPIECKDESSGKSS